jgi:hypothetical protein
MTRAEVERHKANGWGCDQPGHRDGIAVVGAIRYFRRGGQVRVAEHFYCLTHGQEWSACYGIPIEDAPDGSP